MDPISDYHLVTSDAVNRSTTDGVHSAEAEAEKKKNNKNQNQNKNKNEKNPAVKDTKGADVKEVVSNDVEKEVEAVVEKVIGLEVENTLTKKTVNEVEKEVVKEAVKEVVKEVEIALDFSTSSQRVKEIKMFVLIKIIEKFKVCYCTFFLIFLFSILLSSSILFPFFFLILFRL